MSQQSVALGLAKDPKIEQLEIKQTTRTAFIVDGNTKMAAVMSDLADVVKQWRKKSQTPERVGICVKSFALGTDDLLGLQLRNMQTIEAACSDMQDKATELGGRLEKTRPTMERLIELRHRLSAQMAGYHSGTEGAVK